VPSRPAEALRSAAARLELAQAPSSCASAREPVQELVQELELVQAPL
jgi:hypothetical protein